MHNAANGYLIFRKYFHILKLFIYEKEIYGLIQSRICILNQFKNPSDVDNQTVELGKSGYKIRYLPRFKLEHAL